MGRSTRPLRCDLHAEADRSPVLPSLPPPLPISSPSSLSPPYPSRPSSSFLLPAPFTSPRSFSLLVPAPCPSLSFPICPYSFLLLFLLPAFSSSSHSPTYFCFTASSLLPAPSLPLPLLSALFRFTPSFLLLLPSSFFPCPPPCPPPPNTSISSNPTNEKKLRRLCHYKV